MVTLTGWFREPQIFNWSFMVLKINKVPILLTLMNIFFVKNNFVDLMIFFVPLGFQKILQPSEVYPGLLPIFKMEPLAKIAFVAKSPISDSGKCTGSSHALYFAITLD